VPDRNIATTLDAGTVLSDKYVVEAKLGGGGMGQVFRARQRPIDRTVAIKLLHPKYVADAEVQERFLREAQTASQLTHPNTITIYDFGRAGDDLYFIAMEYVDGQPLADLIREHGTLPLDRAGPILIQIAQSLGEAHRKGIIHRDLKPDNVMISTGADGNDQAKVLDFGIAKLTDQNVGLTQTGSVFGTPGYMSPEQARGDEVDSSADFYALTCTLYECLTGELPYKGSSALETMMKHQSDDIPTLGPEFPNELNQFLARGMAKDPRQRLRAADDYIAAFMGCFVDRDPSNRPDSDPDISSSFSTPPGPGRPVESSEFNQNPSAQPRDSDNSGSKTRSSQIPNVVGDQPTREADSLEQSAPDDLAFETTGKQHETPSPASDRDSDSVAGESYTSSPPNDTGPAQNKTPEQTDPTDSNTAASRVSDSHPSDESDSAETNLTTTAPALLVLGVAALLGVGFAVGSVLSTDSPESDEIAAPSSDDDNANPSAKSTASIEITSEPEGAIVSIDGRQLGTTPLETSLDTDEPFDVELNKPGYETESLDDIKPADYVSDPVFVDLDRKTLQLQVTSPVDGATLTVNGTSFGKFPADRTRTIDVPWPDESLFLRLDPPGFEPFIDNIPAANLENPVELQPSRADLVKKQQ